jgi:hypothetical protein
MLKFGTNFALAKCRLDGQLKKKMVSGFEPFSEGLEQKFDVSAFRAPHKKRLCGILLFRLQRPPKIRHFGV